MPSKKIHAYKIPKKIDYDRDLREKADFIYENSREYLIGTSESRKILEHKAVLISSFIFTVISFAMFKVLNFYFEKNLPNPYDPYILIFLLSFIITYIVIAIVVISAVFSPKSEYGVGNLPENLFCEENMQQYFPFMKIGEALSYQQRIQKNLSTNAKSARVLNISLILLFLLPLIEAIVIGLYFLIRA